ncbi:hypothetical protein Scep_013184 [Stephania cephalantha]|uniref:Uncharacterized protein n=1 Tax=Stephania cephalantha TaxID=152367 RepID=A0AAP0JGK8_9MAGN
MSQHELSELIILQFCAIVMLLYILRNPSNIGLLHRRFTKSRPIKCSSVNFGRESTETYNDFEGGDGELGGGRPRADGGDTTDQRAEEVEAAEEEGLLCGERGGVWRRRGERGRSRREVRREEVAFLFAAERSGSFAGEGSAERRRGGHRSSRRRRSRRSFAQASKQQASEESEAESNAVGDRLMTCR